MLTRLLVLLLLAFAVAKSVATTAAADKVFVFPETFSFHYNFAVEITDEEVRFPPVVAPHIHAHHSFLHSTAPVATQRSCRADH
jgi:hypothetical protein